MTDPAPSSTGAALDDPEAVVREFLAALERLDVDRVLELADPAIVYHNKGLPPARGKAAFERQVRWFGERATGFEVIMHNVAAEGPVVLTERTDVVEVGRFRSEFWVCGTFEVRDGRIVLWRDYFDFLTVAWATVVGLVRAVLGGR